MCRPSPLFAGLPAREFESLAATAHEESCRAREYIFHEGDPALWLYPVKTGHVRIVRHSRVGKDVVLELLSSGEIFGGVAVIERRPYPPAAQAREPSVVVNIPADVVIGLAERHPPVVREMALLIGRRLRAAHDSVTRSVEPVEARLAATLLRLADREGVRTKDGRELPFHLTRQSLADMSGTTVETAIRVVSRWLRDEVVKDRGVTGWSCGTGTSCAALRRPQHHDAHGGGRLASRGDAGLVAARGSGFSASSPSTCP